MPQRNKLIRQVRSWLGQLLTLLALGLSSNTASASSVIPLDLEQTMRLAGVAFAGTVRNMESMRLPGGPVTRVTFGDLRMVKGQHAAQEITITMTGGTVDGITTFVVDQPTFNVGERYVVLAYESLGSPADDYSPIVGLYHGFFSIETSASGDRPTVRDWKGRKILGIKDQHLVVLANPAKSAASTVTPRKVLGGDAEAEFKKPRVDTRDPGLRKRVMRPVPRINSNPRPDSTVSTQTIPNARVAEINARLVSENRIPLEVVEPGNDPGTRMSEGDFLGALTRFINAR